MGLFYYIYRFFAMLVSMLPFRLIYILSDVLYLVLYYLVRYRKKVVFTNLVNAFPGITKKEVREMAGNFYRNLADIIMETIKWETMTREQLLERFQFENYELFKRSFETGRSIIVTTGHLGNWEWMGCALDLVTPEKGYAVVKPLSDKRFNKYLLYLRQRLSDGGTIPFKYTFRTMVNNRKEGLSFNVFAADQTPTKSEIHYWTSFLKQETGFFKGPERIARTLDFDVLFMDVKRQGRGKYLGVISEISSNPKTTAENEITEAYVKKLEQAILNHPADWLWSHRRWKHKKEADS